MYNAYAPMDGDLKRIIQLLVNVSISNHFSANFFFSCLKTEKKNKSNCFSFQIIVIYPNEIPMEYLIVFFAVVTILLIAALAALIFILCKLFNFVFGLLNRSIQTEWICTHVSFHLFVSGQIIDINERNKLLCDTRC